MSARATRDLLLACTIWNGRPEQRARAREAARQVPNWDSWMQIVRLHRLVPHALRILDESRDEIPGAVVEQLRNERRAIAARALSRAQQLAELVASLESSGIRVLAFKGPALSISAYGDPGVRDSIDLDLVVIPGQLARASEVIHGAGYVSRHGMSAAQERTLQRAFGHFSYVRAGAPAMVELHWRFAAKRYPWSLPVEDVLERARSIDIGGERVRVPDANDEVLLQAMHGTRHQWERLEWLVAFATLLSRDGVEPAMLLKRARAHGSDRAFRAALRLTSELTAEPLAPPFGAIARDHRAASRANVLRGGIERAIEGHTSTRQPYVTNLRMMDRTTDRVRYLALSVLAPTVREWEVVRFPDLLVALYYPFRLLRLFARRVGAVFATR